MTDKTDEAVGRMRTYLRGNADRHTPQWVADLNTLIDAIKGEQRQELARRFAVALVGTEWCYNPAARDFTSDMVWQWAARLADAEPKIGDAPTEQRRYVCERCGGSGVQPAGCWTGEAYDSIAGRCELCGGYGKL
jgi:hypothetical protein